MIERVNSGAGDHYIPQGEKAVRAGKLSRLRGRKVRSPTQFFRDLNAKRKRAGTVEHPLGEFQSIDFKAGKETERPRVRSIRERILAILTPKKRLYSSREKASETSYQEKPIAFDDLEEAMGLTSSSEAGSPPPKRISLEDLEAAVGLTKYSEAGTTPPTTESESSGEEILPSEAGEIIGAAASTVVQVDEIALEKGPEAIKGELSTAIVERLQDAKNTDGTPKAKHPLAGLLPHETTITASINELYDFLENIEIDETDKTISLPLADFKNSAFLHKAGVPEKYKILFTSIDVHSKIQEQPGTLTIPRDVTLDKVLEQLTLPPGAGTIAKKAVGSRGSSFAAAKLHPTLTLAKDMFNELKGGRLEAGEFLDNLQNFINS